MNKERRKRITGIIDKLEILKEAIEGVQCDEQEAFDNLPEGIQSSERGEAMEDAIYNLEDAYNTIDSVIESLEEAQN